MKRMYALVSGLLLSTLFFFGQSALAAGPDIDDITASAEKNTASASWTTDVSSSCTFEYGTESGVYSARQSSTPGTEHTVYLSRLAENTKHYYRISCTDDDGETTRSAEGSFTTKTAKLAFTDVHVTALGSTKFIVRAETNKNAYLELNYGTSATDLTKNIGAPVNRLSPTGDSPGYFVISGLRTNTTYYFQAKADRTEFLDPKNPESALSDIESETTREAVKITSISPTKGGNGTKLTIKGRGFGGGHSSLNPQLLTAVGIGCKLSKWPKTTPSCLAQVLSWSNSKIVVRVGKGAKTGPVYIGKAYDVGFPADAVNIYTVKGPTFTKK